jgi:hypothetical protein
LIAIISKAMVLITAHPMEISSLKQVLWLALLMIQRVK